MMTDPLPEKIFGLQDPAAGNTALKKRITLNFLWSSPKGSANFTETCPTFT
jgi:hypothetical protein